MGKTTERASSPEPGHNKKRRNLVIKACTLCARRKTKCTGEQPCASCVKLGKECEYKVPHRRGPKFKYLLPSQNNNRTQTASPIPQIPPETPKSTWPYHHLTQEEIITLGTEYLPTFDKLNSNQQHAFLLVIHATTGRCSLLPEKEKDVAGSLSGVQGEGNKQ